MKAIVSRAAGGPESLTLEEIAAPRCGPRQVRIGVQACGVNYPDGLLIQDLYQVKVERPFTPGGEVCGTVLESGSGVTAFKVGDRVIGRCGWGGMAEQVVVAEDRCLQVPDDMPAEEAATFLFGYATSYYALRMRAALQPGESVLVLGAGGGVGSAAVELAKALDARVFAAASTVEKLSLAERLGADGGVVYPAQLDADGIRPLSARFKELAGEKGFDVVVDPVGGCYAEAALRSLGRNGRHLVLGFTAGIPRIPLNLTLLKSCQIVGVDWRAFNQYEPAASAQNSKELLGLYAQRRIRPAVSRRFPLAQGADAIRHVNERAALGRVVVDVAT